MAENDTTTAIRAASTSLQRSFSKKAQGTDALGKEDFLKLMMAQLTHQDPLNPLDSKGMMDQVTAMGSMEQLMNINKNMDELNRFQADIARANAYAFLDKDVTLSGGRVRVSNGSALGLNFGLPQEAAAVKLTITDRDGAVLRSLELGGQGAGTHSAQWDGKNEKGEQVPDGVYTYSVTAQTQDKTSVPVSVVTRGKVSGVRFANGHHLLKVNGEDVDIKDVVEMSNHSEKLFSDQAPRPLRKELEPRPPTSERPDGSTGRGQGTR
jgi:flagellar basal-body rod modification protein FlgD